MGRVIYMFFFAIFGIQDKNKHIGNCNNIVCPSCGRLSMYEVYKYYKYFHIFFLPIFKWDVRYIVKTSCCGCLYELDPLVGKEFEKNPSTEIREENLQRIDRYSPFKYCSNCRTEVPVEYSYCPYCGERL
ncbi:MAG TPA: zinc ribbon domain-containing protein [Hungateiclostridium thermocellum]|jgi:DNA-directed RNA polymerase subunit RPC12/RpoP|nr:hypothetical protein AD2_00809 [Acetivibrio thermocellus AD2]ANV75549.1 hypothetical protein LQRI_0808 [Acetivibrio thermocellus DSM 2360]EIC03296.1 hypothetical protein YSBL_0129 [Acetivibrio thermocellus YS]THJ78546.1 zinc ribbon domain-containing protein [Acetivibrio thermocellus]CDG36121.1 hypothetical protein CTHBC1_1480 [Acetivibrio thermocellus BC1]